MATMLKKTLGIDLSITCPAVVFHKGENWNWKNCKFFYYTSHKKSIFPSDVFRGSLYADWTIDMERYGNISQFILSIVHKTKPQSINLEGYSFGSKGQVYNIGENGGILKWHLHEKSYQCNIIPPTVIKKFATGKGNAKKESMYDAFVIDTGLNLCDTLNVSSPDKSPCSDVVDAYFICKYGHMNWK